MLLDICRLTGGISNIFFGQMIKMFREHSNYTMKCPLKKGYYHVTNVNTGQLLFPVKKFDFLCEGKFFGYLTKGNDKKRISFIKFFGSYSFN